MQLRGEASGAVDVCALVVGIDLRLKRVLEIKSSSIDAFFSSHMLHQCKNVCDETFSNYTVQCGKKLPESITFLVS